MGRDRVRTLRKRRGGVLVLVRDRDFGLVRGLFIAHYLKNGLLELERGRAFDRLPGIVGGLHRHELHYRFGANLVYTFGNASPRTRSSS